MKPAGRFGQYASARNDRLMHRGRGGAGGGIFHRRDAALDRFLHLLEGAHFDLPDSLARDAELVGELYLSPVGLSLVTKIAPARILSMMMGVWLATSFVGGFLAGWLGSFWSAMAKPEFFLLIAAVAALAGTAIWAVRPLLRGMVPE